MWSIGSASTPPKILVQWTPFRTPLVYEVITDYEMRLANLRQSPTYVHCPAEVIYSIRMPQSIVTQRLAGLNLAALSLSRPERNASICAQPLHHGIKVALSSIGDRLAALQSGDLTSLCRGQQAS